MSTKAFAAVWEDSKAQHSTLIVALALADEIRRSCGKPVCWPSKTWLATKARLSERKVDEAIDALVTMGELVKIPDDELDMYARQSLGKTGTQNLYIVCIGHTQSTIHRVDAWLRGADSASRKSCGGIPDTPGGHSAQNGGAESRTHKNHDPDPGTEPGPDLFSLPEWAIPGARAIWQAEGRQHVGEIVEDDDGELRFSSTTISFTRPRVRTLLGHLVPMLDGPDLVDAEAPEPEPEEQSRL